MATPLTVKALTAPGDTATVGTPLYKTQARAGSGLDGPVSALFRIKNTDAADIAVTLAYADDDTNGNLASGGTALLSAVAVAAGATLERVIPLKTPTRGSYARFRLTMTGTGTPAVPLVLELLGNATLREYAERHGENQFARGKDSYDPPILR